MGYGFMHGIPSSVDANISFQEQIDHLYKLIAQLNKDIQNMLDNSAEYTDTQINLLREELKAEINLTEQLLTALIDDVSARNDERYAHLEQELAKVYMLFQYFYNIITLETDAKLTELYERIKTDFGTTCIVRNPVTWIFDTLQNTLNDMWNAFTNINALTVGEYEALQITVGEYAVKNIRVNQYTRAYMSEKFVRKAKHYFNPITGKLDYLQNILDTLAALHSTALTVSEYEAKGLTVEDYEALELTVEEYNHYT